MDLLANLRFAIIFSLILGLASCQDSSDSTKIGTDVIESPATLKDNKNKELPAIEFEETEFSTGKITQGEVRNFEFHFTNTGDAPLIISKVTGSCGCTVARDYPQGKIQPGESGSIKVEFNSDGKWGKQVVTVNVTTNAIPALAQLLIRTEIIVPDNLKINK